MKNIVCYGDSNTFGQNPEFSVDQTKPFRHDFDKRWTGILSQMLDGKCRIIEEGLSGRTTILDNPVEPHRNGLKTLPACLMSHDPIDLLIVMLGTNDLRDCFNPIPFSVINGMNRFLAECVNPYWRLSGNQMKILLISPVPVKDSKGKSPWPGLFSDKDAVELSQHMPEYYKVLAETYHIEFMDAAEYAEASDIDFVHMTAENHKKLADAVAVKVNEILEL